MGVGWAGILLAFPGARDCACHIKVSAWTCVHKREGAEKRREAFEIQALVNRVTQTSRLILCPLSTLKCAGHLVRMV